MRNGQNVLIVATDPMLAALVGGLVEALRLQAVFPRPGENPDAAVARVRPLAVILMEGSSGSAGSEILLVRARRRGARVMLFGDAASIAPLREWAKQADVASFMLPDELEGLRQALERTNSELRVARRGDRRAPVDSNPDGSVTFHDAAGTRWQVYDRRTGDRRAREMTREFINAAGDRRIYLMHPEDVSATSPAQLADQLARATPTSGTSEG